MKLLSLWSTLAHLYTFHFVTLHRCGSSVQNTSTAHQSKFLPKSLNAQVLQLILIYCFFDTLSDEAVHFFLPTQLPCDLPSSPDLQIAHCHRHSLLVQTFYILEFLPHKSGCIHRKLKLKMHHTFFEHNQEYALHDTVAVRKNHFQLQQTIHFLQSEQYLHQIPSLKYFLCKSISDHLQSRNRYPSGVGNDRYDLQI